MDNIKVNVEEKSAVERKMTVEVPVEEVDRYFQETFKEYRRHANLPGFRKGKVPADVVRRRFLGDITEDVTRRILPDSYEQALTQTGLKPVSEPKVGEFKLEEGKPLSFVAEFEIMPSFEVADYLGLELESREAEVSEEEVGGILEEMRAGQATVVKVDEERGLRTGDVALIDFEGVADGKPVPGGSAKDFPLTIGSDTFLPGFEDSLIGASAGEEREFFLKLPDDFQETELAGREAKFTVLVKELRERHLPELDDEFAKDVGDLDSLEALKERLRSNLKRTKELTARNDLKEQLVARLVESHPFAVPSSLVDHRRVQMMANVERNLLLRGISREEIEKGRGKMYEEAAAPAERKVRASLILEAVADKENIAVTDEELNAEVKKIAEQNKLDPGEARRRMVESGSLDNLREILREDKTVDYLLEKANVVTADAAAQPAPEKGKA